VQRYARDLLRMKADLSCQEMEFAEMVAMTGISFMPEAGAAAADGPQRRPADGGPAGRTAAQQAAGGPAAGR
jgi:hypothetical protein